jgi:hypothetical protein
VTRGALEPTAGHSAAAAFKRQLEKFEASAGRGTGSGEYLFDAREIFFARW